MNNKQLNRRSFLTRIGGASMLTLAGLGIVSCYHEEAYEQPDSEPDGPSTGDDAAHEIMMIGSGGQFIFEPDRLVIQPGDTVRFVIESSSHTATAYHPDNRSSSPLRIPQGAPAWNSGFLSSGESFEYTFETEGVHNYYCSPHEGAGMVGIIVVGSALDGPGMATPQDSIPDAARSKLTELIEWARQQS